MQYKQQPGRSGGRIELTFLLFAILVFFFAVPHALAVDYTWQTAEDGFFNGLGITEPNHWGLVLEWPDDNTDKAIFDKIGTYAVSFGTLYQSTITNKQLEVSAGTVTLELYWSSSDSVTYILDPTVMIDGDTIAAVVGTSGGNLAHLKFEGNGYEYGNVEADGGLWIGRDSGSLGKVAMISRCNWTSTWPTIVGVNGSGSLNIYSGTMTNSNGVLGANIGSVGLVTIDSYYANWINTGNLTIGNYGPGTLFLDNGEVTNYGDAYIAVQGGSTSSVQVTEGTWHCNASLYVGGDDLSSGGNGSIIFDGDGTVMVSDDMTVWSTGTVNVNDGSLSVTGDLITHSGSSLNLAGGNLSTSMDNFYPAAGTFNWTSGTLGCGWSDVYIDSGQPLGSSLEVGLGKLLNYVDAIYVGTTSAGILTIDGGQVESQSGQVGNVGATTATAVVRGEGSSWIITGGLNVRSGSSANLTVENGAYLSNLHTFAASLSGTTANIDINDADTLWYSSGSAFLGGTEGALGGSGSLDLTNDATMDIDGNMTVWDNFNVAIEDSQLDVGGTLSTSGDIDVAGTCYLTTGDALIAAAAGGTADINLDAVNGQWHSSGSVYLGGGYAATAGSGTLDLTNQASMSVADSLTVWNNFDVTLTDSQLYVGTSLTVRGSLIATGTSVVQATQGFVTVASGASLSIAETASLDIAGSTLLMFAGGTLDGMVSGDADTGILMIGGGLWTTTGALEVGASSAGAGKVGGLTLMSGATVNSTGSIAVQDSSRFTLGGGTITAASIDFGSQDFEDYGTLNGDVTIGGRVIATGDLTLGDAKSYTGVYIGTGLDVGTHTVTVNKAGFFNVGIFTNVSGGTLNVPGGVAIPVGNSLVASGAINGRLAAQPGSTIDATGDLLLGDAASPAGFLSYGELFTHDHTVTIYDANQSVLGSLSTLGTLDESASPGTLVAANGVLVEFANNVVGYGTIDTPNNPDTPLINNGYIGGNSGARPITLTGYVKGVGTLDNVVIAGTLSPGFSPCKLAVADIAFAETAALLVELGGLNAGSEFDQINVDGIATLDGTLDVRLLGDFRPAHGDSFQILTFDSRNGDFSDCLGLDLGGGLSLERSFTATSMVLTAIFDAIPGDANSDGRVDDADAEILATYWLTGVGATWEMGDFNGDGAVNDIDATLLAANWQSGTSNAAAPEPGMLTLLATCGLTLLGLVARRRK